MNLKYKISLPQFIGFILLVCFSCATRGDFFQLQKFPNGLLWRVQKIGVPDSFIFGTIHLIDSRITKLPAKVQEILGNKDQIDTLCTEVPFDRASLQYASASIFLREATNLNAIVGEVLYERTAVLLERKLISRDTSARLKPWAAMVFLMWFDEQQLPLDGLLYQAGVQRNLKVCGLETMAELIGLVDSFPVKSQTLMLQVAVDNYMQIPNMWEKMAASYLTTDLLGLVDATHDGITNSQTARDLNKTFIENVLTNRNRILVNRMQTQLNQGKAFIVISALRLPGNEGVLNLLEQQGYKITRIF